MGFASEPHPSAQDDKLESISAAEDVDVFRALAKAGQRLAKIPAWACRTVGGGENRAVRWGCCG